MECNFCIKVSHSALLMVGVIPSTSSPCMRMEQQSLNEKGRL